jgi:histone arginine demethylase JMJD6
MQGRREQNGLIERRESLRYEEFVTGYLNPHKPVILVDALRSWKAIGKWTPQFFAERYGSRELMIDGRVYNLRDLIHRVMQSDADNQAPYLRNTPVRDVSSDLLADISPLPEYLFPNWLETHFYPAKINQILGRAVIPDIFIGGRSCAFPFLHFDLVNSHAFLGQIYGKKTFSLYSPDQTPWLYQSSEVPNRSLITNIAEPDFGKFPLFKHARPLTGPLNQGEMMFVPAGWWHSARLLGPSITVSINVANSSNWKGLIKDQYTNARTSPKLLHRLAAAPLAAYLAGVGVYRSLVAFRS